MIFARVKEFMVWTHPTSGDGRAKRVAIRLIAVLLATFLSAGTLRAAEPWQAFLDGLRDRELHDMALLYLDRMAAEPACPADLKQVLDYEVGVTLMTSPGAPAAREQALDDAQARFQKFLAEHPDHSMASLATSQLANVLIERGRARKTWAERPEVDEKQRKKLLAEAREFFNQAQTALAEAEKRYLAALKKMRAESRAEASPEVRQMQSDLVRAKLYLADAAYEIAMTHPADGAARRKTLGESAKLYNAIYDAYYTRFVGKLIEGLYARLREGRCYQDAGRYVEALAVYDEVLAESNSSRVPRELANKAVVLSLETLTHPDVKKHADAVAKWRAWERTAPASDQVGADGLAIKYLAAVAHLEQMRGLDRGNPDRAAMRGDARRLFRQVARLPGVYRAKAQDKLGDPLLGLPDDGKAEPTTFAEARDRAEAAKNRMQTAIAELRKAESEGRTEDIEKSEREAAEAMAEGIKYCRMALDMATSDASDEELNLLRNYLAYLHWKNGDLYEAAVLGAFLADRYPASPVARPAAQIAMLAYADLYSQSPPGPVKEFARGRMLATAERIVERWPTSAEAGDTWLTLIQQAAMVDRDIDAAMTHLERVPQDSPQRGRAEVIVGDALWTEWIRAMQADPVDRPDSKELDELLDRAETLLASGVKRLTAEGKVDASLVAAQYALARLYIERNRPEEAVKVLDEPAAGLVVLAGKGNLPGTAQGFESAIYKTALQAYVAAQELDKAQAVMDSLEKSVAAAGDAEASSQLTEVYIGLSRDLQKTLELLREQGRTDEVLKVSRGFELFLDRIARRQQGNSFGSLAWVAATFAEMAARFDTEGQTLSPEAKQYYERAVAVYREILKRSADNPQFAGGDSAIDGVKIRLARCLRRLRKFRESMDLLVDVLRFRNRIVEAQVEAALTYQEWAATSGDARMYDNAINGGRSARRKDGTQVNVVWGWQKLGNITLRSAAALATFHESRYNLARCRFEQALGSSGDQRNNLLARAEKDIEVTRLLTPDMGGDAWRDRYDSLLKRIQTVQGKKPVGFGATTK
ncbi:MAG: hypothetical protein GX621_13580 [Pirellulaceae bacterium]|nr:hypothetical protein [Pirellulaceae bacterium]